MTGVHYLTVPDMLWLNLQLARKVQSYSFATLEEATFTQYGYGDSQGLSLQAAQFLVGFRRLRPFPRGNEAGAFIGCLTFLAMNGRSLDVPPDGAAAWCRRIWADPSVAWAEIESRVCDSGDDPGHGTPDTMAIADGFLTKYAAACEELNAAEAPVPLA